MDVTLTRYISELRSERERIERTILFLERFDRLSIESAEIAAQSVTHINCHSPAAMRRHPRGEPQ
jgi:hypothetical protein